MENRRESDIAIGKNIAEIRKKANLTQKEISQVVGVNTSTYKHYELGDRAVPISVIKDLATFYKVSTNYFFENMPELSPKEEIEISDYAFKIANSKGYFTVNGDPEKYFNDLEKKIQARARLRIKQYRIENKKNQKDLADFLGITVSAYNKYEKGSRSLSNEVVRKIAEYYDIKVSDILD